MTTRRCFEGHHAHSPPVRLFVDDAGAILEKHRQLAELRDALPFEIDGLVVKVDSFALQKELGTRSVNGLNVFDLPADSPPVTMNEVQRADEEG